MSYVWSDSYESEKDFPSQLTHYASFSLEYVYPSKGRDEPRQVRGTVLKMLQIQGGQNFIFTFNTFDLAKAFYGDCKEYCNSDVAGNEVVQEDKLEFNMKHCSTYNVQIKLKNPNRILDRHQTWLPNYKHFLDFCDGFFFSKQGFYLGKKIHTICDHFSRLNNIERVKKMVDDAAAQDPALHTSAALGSLAGQIYEATAGISATSSMPSPLYTIAEYCSQKNLPEVARAIFEKIFLESGDAGYPGAQLWLAEYHFKKDRKELSEAERISLLETALKYALNSGPQGKACRLAIYQELQGTRMTNPPEDIIGSFATLCYTAREMRTQRARFGEQLKAMFGQISGQFNALIAQQSLSSGQPASPAGACLLVGFEQHRAAEAPAAGAAAAAALPLVSAGGAYPTQTPTRKTS